MAETPPEPQAKPLPLSANEVNSLLPKNTARWEVYTQPKCDYSTKVVELLKKNGETNIEIIDIVERQLIMEFYKQGLSRTPAVFRNGKYFGGYQDIIGFFQSKFVDPALIKR